jgi:hypothetical protein
VQVKLVNKRVSLSVPEVLATARVQDEKDPIHGECLRALFEWAGVDPSSYGGYGKMPPEAWMKVISFISYETLPCFHSLRDRQNIGRPRLDNGSDEPHMDLIEAVIWELAAAEKRRERMTIQGACEKLIEAGSLPSRYDNRSATTLAKLYGEGKKLFNDKAAHYPTLSPEMLARIFLEADCRPSAVPEEQLGE